MAVPDGFRLAVDAVQDDPAHADTQGVQEADDLDPLRMNSGWARMYNTDGTPELDKNGNVRLDPEAFIHEGVTTNAPKSSGFNTSVKNSPTIGQASYLGEKGFAGHVRKRAVAWARTPRCPMCGMPRLMKPRRR